MYWEIFRKYEKNPQGLKLCTGKNRFLQTACSSCTGQKNVFSEHTGCFRATGINSPPQSFFLVIFPCLSPQSFPYSFSLAFFPSPFPQSFPPCLFPQSCSLVVISSLSPQSFSLVFFFLVFFPSRFPQFFLQSFFLLFVPSLFP